VACESSSLRVADTANVGVVAWLEKRVLPNIAAATVVHVGNVLEKNHFLNFF